MDQITPPPKNQLFSCNSSPCWIPTGVGKDGPYHSLITQANNTFSSNYPNSYYKDDNLIKNVKMQIKVILIFLLEVAFGSRRNMDVITNSNYGRFSRWIQAVRQRR